MNQIKFLYSQNQLKDIAQQVIQQALKTGADAAYVELSEGISTTIDVLNQEIETFETSHENQLLLTVFCGNNKGHVGLSYIDVANLSMPINQAIDIAKYTQPDIANGLLEPEYQAPIVVHDLELFFPPPIDNRQLINSAKLIEQTALSQSPQITASDGASISLDAYNFLIATSNGFNQGACTSHYSNSVSLIAQATPGMQTDYWYSAARNYNQLLDSQSLAQTAASRVLRRLNKGSYTGSSTAAVIFESTIAKSIISSLVSALSGNNLYRRLSFLNDSLGSQILPEWINIVDDPFVKQGLSSCYFDSEGGKVSPRHIIRHGRVAGYLLAAYSARKMHMQPTGNAGGAHNLIVNHNFEGNLEQLAQVMGSGIIIIETIGHGLNIVTGDYSVGASGLAVINGHISHFVDNITIAGNMRAIYSNIINIANDSSAGSSISCGSILVADGIINISR